MAKAPTRRVTRADLAAVVSTQAHAITVEHLLGTLTSRRRSTTSTSSSTCPGPDPLPLRSWRCVASWTSWLERPSQAWPAQRVVRIATGRSQPTADEAVELGDVATRLPLFC